MVFGRGRSKHVNGAKTIPVSAEAFTIDDAHGVQGEYDAYTRRILATLARGTLVVALSIALYYWILFASSLGSGRPKPTVVLVPGAVFLAAISLLAVMVTALVVMVRTPSAAKIDHSALGRRLFLSNLARLFVTISLGLGVYGALSGLATAPDEIDIVRIFGPVFAGVVIAVFAADACVAADDGIDRSVVAEAHKQANVQRLAQHETALTGTSKPPSAWSYISGTLVLLAAPFALMVIAQLHKPFSDPLDFLARLSLVLAFTVATYMVVLENYRIAARGEWTLLAMSTVMPVLFITMILLAVAQSETAYPSASWQTFAWAIGNTLACFASPAIAGVISLKSNPRGILRHLAIRLATKRLQKARHPTPKDVVPMNPLAVASLILSPFFPFGPILAVVAIEQIRTDRKRQPRVDRRGEGTAQAAIGISVGVLALCFGALFWLGLQGAA